MDLSHGVCFGGPGGALPDHGVQDGQHLSHAGDHGDLMRLATRFQPLVEGPDYGVRADRRGRCHVQQRTHMRAAAVNGAPTAHDAAVAIERGKANQSGYRAPIELSELRQLDHEGARGYRSDALEATQQFIFGAPGRRAPKPGSDIDVELSDLLLQLVDVRFDAFAHRPLHKAQAIHFLHAHRHELAPTHEQLFKLAGLFIGQAHDLGLDRLSERRNHLGVNAIVLREPPARLGEVANLPRIDHGDPQSSAHQCSSNRSLVPTGRLHHDQVDRCRLQRLGQIVDAIRIVGELQHFTARQHSHIECCLRYVDSHHLLFIVHRSSSCPSLATMRAQPLAQPFGLTKRSGGATMLINGLATHGGKGGLPRRRCDEKDTPCSTYKGVGSRRRSGGFVSWKNENPPALRATPLIRGAKSEAHGCFPRCSCRRWMSTVSQRPRVRERKTPITISATRIEKATLISTTSGMPLAPVAARIRPFSIDMKPMTWLTALRREIIISRPSRITDSAKARSSRASVPACAVTGSITMTESATRPMPASIVWPMLTTGSICRWMPRRRMMRCRAIGMMSAFRPSAIAAVM